MTSSIVRYALRISMVAALVVAFVTAMAGPAGATPQRRAPGDPNSAGSAAICGTLGGNASVVNDGFDLQIDGSKGASKTSTTHCQGGLLDGMTCANYDNGTSNCTMNLVGGDDRPDVETTGEIEVDGPVIETVEVSTDQTADPGTIEEPVTVEESPVLEESVEPAGAEDTETNQAPADDVVDGQDEPSDPVITADPATVDETIDPAPSDGAVADDPTADPVYDPVVIDTEIVYEPVDATMEWQELEEVEG